MTQYLVELYISKASCAAVALGRARLTRAAAELTAEGRPTALLRSIFVPEDETCFLLVEAPSAEVVREAARRAQVPYERVVETELDLEATEPEGTTASTTRLA